MPSPPSDPLPQVPTIGVGTSDAVPPNYSRFGGVVRFLLAHQLHTAITLAVGFLTTPILLAWLGSARYGLVRVLEAWGTMLGVVILCLTIGMGNGLVSRLAAGDWASIRRFLAASMLVAVGASLVVIAVGLALLPFLPDLVPSPPELTDERTVAYLISLSALVLSPLVIARVLFEADQRGFRVTLMLTATALLTTGLSLAAASAGWGLPGQSAVTVLANGVCSVGIVIWAVRSYPEFGLSRPSKAEVGAVVAVTGHLLISGIFGQFASRAEVFATSQQTGPDGVTRYILTQRLFGLWQGQLLALGTALWAPLSDLYFRGANAAFRDRLGLCARAVFGLSFSAAIPIAVYTPHFLRLWRVGSDQFAGDWAAVAFGLTIPLAAAQSLLGWVITSTGQVRRTIPGSGLYAATALGGCFGLGAAFGLTGIAFGMMLASAVILGWNIFVLSQVHRVPAGMFLLPFIKGLALAIPIMLAARWVTAGHEPFGWVGLIGEMGGWFILYSVGWFILSGRTERREWRTLLSRIWGARRAG